MRAVSRFLPYVVALAIVIASGLVHGRWTGRWVRSTALAERVAALGRVPKTIGDWEGQDMTLDRHTLLEASIDGYVMRRYQDQRSGRAVTLLIVCGKPGPIAVHTPEVCYAGSGYLPQGLRTKFPEGSSSGAGSDTFWVAELRKPGAIAAGTLQVYYSWSVGGAWRNSEEPRWDFAGAPALYKLYVVRETTTDQESIQDGSAADFLHALLPELRQSLSLVAKPTS